MRLFWVLLFCYCIYAAVFIFETSYVTNGERYFTLFDDAMVSMRYARNLAQGFGLVWNPGEQAVEGYTNLLWTLYMSFLHLLPVPESKISLLVQLTGAGLVIANLFAVRSICQRLYGGNSLLISGAVALTAFYMPSNNWALQGMEVSVLTLVVSTVVLLAVKSLENNKFNPFIYLILGVAILVRMDATIPFFAFLAWSLLYDRQNLKEHLMFGLGSFALFSGALQLFRYLYYHEVLPNTYYLKLAGYPTDRRILQGLFNFGRFAYKMDPILLAIAFAHFFFKPLRGGIVEDPDRVDEATIARTRKVLVLMAMLVVGQVAYSIYVGGDAWEMWGSRYITIVMPCFFMLFTYGLGALPVSNIKWQTNAMRALAYASSVLVFVVAMFSFNSLPGLWYWMLVQPPYHVKEWHNMLEVGLLLRENTKPEARVATTMAGTIPYFCHRQCVDILGKNDAVIARQPMHSFEKLLPEEAKQTWFYPGHMKWDYKYSIGQLAPDVVTDLWVGQEEAQGVLGAYQKVRLGGFSLWFRKGSANIIWDSPQVEIDQQTSEPRHE